MAPGAFCVSAVFAGALMPDDVLTESAVLESSAGAESVAESGSSFPDLGDVLAAEFGDLSDDAALKSDDADDDDALDTALAEGSDSPESLKPAGESEPQPKLTRRQQQEQERRAELDQHKTAAQQAQEALDALKAERDRDRQAAFATLGDDARFAQLQARYEAFKTVGYDPEISMDMDELAEYKSMLPQRQHAATLMGMAREAIRAQDQAQLASAVKEFDLNAAEFVGLDAAAALRKAIPEIVKRTEAKAADRIAQLEASEMSLVTKQAGRSKAPGPAGLSDAAGRSAGLTWDPQKRGADNLETAIAGWMSQDGA